LPVFKYYTIILQILKVNLPPMLYIGLLLDHNDRTTYIIWLLLYKHRIELYIDYLNVIIFHYVLLCFVILLYNKLSLHVKPTVLNAALKYNFHLMYYH